MNDEQLEDWLRAAADSSPRLTESPDLGGRVRRIFQRRQARNRRFKNTACLAVCYAAGMLTTSVVFALRPSEQSDAADLSPLSAGRPAQVASAKVTPKIDAPSSEQTVKKPVVLKINSMIGLSRYELLRRMGDECQQRSDFPAAVAHYKSALDAATKKELEISFRTDNWLLISLKKDRYSGRQKGDSI